MPRHARILLASDPVTDGKLPPDTFDQRLVLIGVTGLGQGSEFVVRLRALNQPTA